MVRGRPRSSELPYDIKHPLLLPKQSLLTMLLIDYKKFIGFIVIQEHNQSRT